MCVCGGRPYVGRHGVGLELGYIRHRIISGLEGKKNEEMLIFEPNVLTHAHRNQLF